MYLSNRQWHRIEDTTMPETIRSWIIEPDSMTRRFEKYCKHVHVALQFEGFIGIDQVAESREKLLPVSQRYWLREVILYGDNEPWLFGRTVVPESTLGEKGNLLTTIGSTPLGRYLFNGQQIGRDFIQVSLQNDCWARRSRLRLSGSPLLLTEVFLPAAPVYQTGSE